MIIYNNPAINIANFPPGVIVDVVPPQPAGVPGVATNTIFLVGTAQGGAINSAISIQDYSDYQSVFGNALNEQFDMGSFILLAQQKGSNNFVCTRVTDGTEAAATATIVDVTGSPVTGMTLTSINKGTLYNSVQVVIGAGSNSTTAVKTYKISITLPNAYTEIFDNIGGTGGALWTAMVSAINNGQSQEDAPSTLVTAAIGTATAAPKLQSYTMTGGTSGNAGVAASTLVGTDTTPATGMYATRNKGVGNMALVGVTDPTTFGAQATFGQQEGRFMITSGPIGQTSAAAITALQGSGVSSTALKYLVGDWEYWFDSVNNIWRYSTQQAAAASVYSILSPNESGLNYNLQLDTTIITQRSQANRPYSSDEIIALSNAGIDVIAYNINLGSYFALQTGKNSAYPQYQDSFVAGWDTYSRLTPYIAFSLQNANVQFVGKLLTPDIELLASAINNSFLQGLVTAKWIGDINGGKAFSVAVVAQGNTLVLNIAIVMFDVISNVLINLQNGAFQISAPAQNNALNRKKFNLV